MAKRYPIMKGMEGEKSKSSKGLRKLDDHVLSLKRKVIYWKMFFHFWFCLPFMAAVLLYFIYEGNLEAIQEIVWKNYNPIILGGLVVVHVLMLQEIKVKLKEAQRKFESLINIRKMIITDDDYKRN